MRTVLPESEQTAIALACTSMDMPQVAWEMASTMLWILNSLFKKRFS